MQFKDPTKGASNVMLLELRIGAADSDAVIKGAQTVFPGSVHEWSGIKLRKIIKWPSIKRTSF